MTKKNPFSPHTGYYNSDEFPISGYGVTIETIQWWLFEHDLPTNAIGFEKATGKKEKDVEEDTEYIDYLAAFNPKLHISYMMANGDEPVAALMVYSQTPQEDSIKVIPPLSTIREEIISAIEQLYDVDNSYHDALLEFVNRYAYYIEFCEYN